MEAADIKQIRECMGLTQTELAERLGVSQVAVSMWEKGQRPCQGPAAILLNSLRSEFEKKLARSRAR